MTSAGDDSGAIYDRTLRRWQPGRLDAVLIPG